MNHTEIANHNPHWKSTFLDVISAVSMAGGSIIKFITPHNFLTKKS